MPLLHTKSQKKKATNFQSLSFFIFVTIPKDDSRKKNTHRALLPLIFVQLLISSQKPIKTTSNQSKTEIVSPSNHFPSFGHFLEHLQELSSFIPRSSITLLSKSKMSNHQLFLNLIFYFSSDMISKLIF